ncbi:MAG TPA: hypothetical protein DEP84_02730 [Chloroflexi bacterium]|nr:hypothetical protein [Chloroflexota bacterium]
MAIQGVVEFIGVPGELVEGWNRRLVAKYEPPENVERMHARVLRGPRVILVVMAVRAMAWGL